jgi:hypothetical protein
MCQKLGWQPSWDFQKVDKILTRQDKWNLLEVMPVSHRALSVASENDLDDQNLLLATVKTKK